MKSTFKEAFNRLDDDFTNLDYDLDEKMDIDIAKIKADVFARLRSDNKIKNYGKKATKKLTILLIAAVILVSMAIGTIYASNGVQGVFKEFFNGNLNSAGLYSGEDIAFTSTDPNLGVELLGVSGDNRKLYTVLEVTKKDGTAITDEGYQYPYLLTNDGKSLWEHYECYASYTDKDGNYFGPTADLIDYSLSDDRKSLKIMFLVSAQDKSLKGSTLTITSKSFGARKMIESFARKYSFNEEYDLNEIEKRQKELGIGNAECSQVYNGEYYEYGYTDSKTYQLPFKLSFTINNIGDDDKIEKKLTVEKAPNFVKPIADKVTMEISSFGININCKCKLEDYELARHTDDEISYKPIDYEHSKIIMNDGTEYFLNLYSDCCTKGVIREKKNYYYEENIILGASRILGDSEESEINLIDIHQINTIIINDNVVYKK